MARNSALVLVAAVVCLVALGLVMLLSVSAFAPDNLGNTMYFIVRQTVWLGVGITVCLALARWDYHVWMKGVWLLVGVTLLLLILTLVPGIGREINGSHRWLRFGFVNLQPSEIAKFATVVFLAWWYGRGKVSFEDWRESLLKPMGVVLAMVAVLARQPDLGTAAILILLSFIVLFMAGLPLRWIMPMPFLGAGGILGLAMLMPERMGRLMAFVNPEAHKSGEGYQVWMGLVALGSGGPTGLGLGNSVQKMLYVPEAHTDFILPIIGEELGLVFTLSLVFCYLLIAVAGGTIACHAPDLRGVMLGVGLTSLVCMQALMNMAVVTSLMPAKGLGLPFISYGGSNLLVCCASIGILLNIHRQADYGTDAVRHLTPAGKGAILG